ncbi:MAG: TonB-dependent receptor domain-containing protein [Acidobacteriota bacterium]
MKTRTLCFAFFGVILTLIFSPLQLLGQIDTASVQGIVRDQQGAVVPGVDVTAMNLGTSETTSAVTNEQGFYKAAALPIGEYEVRAVLPGFKTAVRTGLTLEVGDIARVDLTLELGEIAEQVVVSGEAPLLESETSSVGQVIAERAISDLPLNGRQYVQLAKLSAGVLDAPRGDRGGASGFIANGVRGTMNDFRLDGQDNNARSPGMQQRTYDTVRPSVDAIAEFRVETHNFSAEYGRAAGAVINARVKSGTNRFRGSLFEFHRNDVFDARHFFSPPDDPKPPLIRNQFGGTIGGPIVRDSAFFFFSYEGTRERRGITIVETVPTAAMRAGNFSAFRPIFDPATSRANPDGNGSIRDRFPHDVIPADRFDPVAVKLMETLLLDPNQPGIVNNFIVSPTRPFDGDQFTTRLDWNISDRDNLFGRYHLSDRGDIDPRPFDLGGGVSDTVRGQSLAIGETHTFSPGTINEFRIGYSRLNPIRSLLVDERKFEEFGIHGIPPDPRINGLPRFRISEFVNMGNQQFHPNQKIPENIEVTDNISFIRGNHTLKTGFTYRWQRAYFNISGNARGDFRFNGVFTQDPQNRGKTGSGFADFLLGLPHISTIEQVFSGDIRNSYWGFFVQDDWKVVPDLTLNLGIRYELFFPESEIHNRQANFLVGPNKLIYPNNEIPEGIPADLVTQIPEGVDSRALRGLDTNNFSPRLGVAWKFAPKTVLRAGGGIFYAEGFYTIIGGSTRQVGNPPFRLREQFRSNRIKPKIVLSEGFPADALSGAGEINPSRTTFRSHDPGIPTSYATHWNLDIQHEFPARLLVDIGYTGTKGTQLPVVFDANQPLPGPGDDDERRPIQGFGDLTRIQAMDNSTYHAFWVRVERRFTDGFSVLANYTYGKAISTQEQQFSGDPKRSARNIFWERALTNFDVRQRFVGSYLWELPVGTGQHWDLGSPLLNSVLGNWQLNGIITLRDGQPFTPSMAFSTANTGDDRPDRLRDGNLPDDQQSIHRWFDKEAFAPADASIFEFGDAGRNILFGPGVVNFDLSLFKRVPFPMLGERGEVQLRVEAFNAFNTPQFGHPNSQIDRPQGATIDSLSNRMREWQFGLKVLF